MGETHKEIFSRLNDKETRDAAMNAALNAQLGEIKGTLESMNRNNDTHIKLLESLFNKLSEKLK